MFSGTRAHGIIDGSLINEDAARFEVRFTTDDMEGYIQSLKDRDFALLLYGSPIGFFGILRFMIGEPNIHYPSVDHAFPPDIYFEQYRYFREGLNRLVDPSG